MREVTLTLTDDQERFLKLFAKNHYPGSKQNLCTTCPIHVVQSRRERVVDPDFTSCDVVKFVVPDWEHQDFETAEELVEEFYQDEDCPIDIVSFDEAYKADEFIGVDGKGHVIVDEADYLEAYGIKDNFYFKAHLEYYYEPIAYFFILEEAKKYIQYQGHNLCHPRTYTYSQGYANKGEYEHFWDLLFNLGKSLNDTAESGVA